MIGVATAMASGDRFGLGVACDVTLYEFCQANKLELSVTGGVNGPWYADFINASVVHKLHGPGQGETPVAALHDLVAKVRVSAAIVRVDMVEDEANGTLMDQWEQRDGGCVRKEPKRVRLDNVVVFPSRDLVLGPEELSIVVDEYGAVVTT